MQGEASSRLPTSAIVSTTAIERQLLRPCPWKDRGYEWDYAHCHSIGLGKHQYDDDAGGDAGTDVDVDADAVSLHWIQNSGQDWAG